MIQAKALAELDGVQHRFFTRRGGVSAGLYSSLNCGYGSGDPPDNVRENRRRVAAAFDLGEADLLTVHQIHLTDVLAVAEQRWSSPGAPKADALVTDRPGVVLGVLAADCAPFLAQDEANGVFFRQAPRAGHFLFDLAGYLAHRIARIGVAVDVTGHDTLAARDDFFSYRRNTLKGVRDYGRGL